MIKVISWDVYGTLIATPNEETRDDVEDECIRAREYAL